MMMHRTMGSMDLALLTAFASHARPELDVSSVEDKKTGLSAVVVDGFNGPDDLEAFASQLKARTGVKL